jgi:hypothetical protein
VEFVDDANDGRIARNLGRQERETGFAAAPPVDPFTGPEALRSAFTG